MNIKNKKLIIIALTAVGIDQLIKYIIINTLKLNSSLVVIKNLFNITYVENSGAAFSVLSGNRIFLILVSFIFILIFYYLFLHNKKIDLKDTIIYGLLYGGILGNLIDRIMTGYVIDYLDFKIFNYNFPIFNFADMCIVISIIILLIFILRGEFNEHNNK